MATILEKAQTLISANLHAMVDRALEANSVAVMKQYIRDAEGNLAELEEAAATVGGEVKTLERRYLEYKKKSDGLDRNIDMLLMQGKTDLARAAQNELNSARRFPSSAPARMRATSNFSPPNDFDFISTLRKISR